jgi:membrane protein insertase Oxa1/YidC/SpoIIIJ
MNYVYLVFVRPIELLLGFLFGFYYRLSGNYGVSLILLSVSVTLLTAPLYYLAEKWKRDEEEIGYRMRRDLASVRRNYSGQKRFYLTRNVHRLFGYSPLLQLKASFGLFVQIPFFFGAYELLSHYEGLRGQAFLFLPDLGKQDALLGGMNLLPFAMTAINLCSSLAYTKSLSLRRNSTLLIMALLFLVLLYDRPSALLLYWSMNNLLSLGKNLFFPAKQAKVPADIEEEPGWLAKGLSRLKELYGGSLYRPALILALLAAIAAQSWWLAYRAISYQYCFIAAAALAASLSLAAAIASFARLGPRRAAASLAPLAAAWILFAASAYVLYFERRQNALISNRNIKMLSTLIADLAAWMAAARLGPKAPSDGAARRGWGLYAAGLGYVGLTLFILSPLRVYFSSPTDMGVGPLALALSNLPGMGAFLALGCLPPLAVLLGRGRISSRGAEELLVAAIIAGIAYSLLTGASYGILDEFALDKAFLLDSPPLWQFAADIAIVFAALVAARYLCRSRRRSTASALAILAAVAAIQVGAAAARAEPGALAAASSSVAGAAADDSVPPKDSAEMHRFSRRGRNVVFIIADMCNGNYLGKAVDEDPSRAAKLEGFTWWPNTLTGGSVTATSLPSIYGGRDYEPARLGAMAGTGRDKLGRAAAGFFGRLLDSGFAVTAVDALYADYESFSRGGKLRTALSSQYVGLWKSKRGAGAQVKEGSKNALLTMLGLFGSAPYMLKARIYDEGSWIVFRKSYQFDYIAKKTLGNYAYLDLLPELSSASGEAEPLAIFIHTQFTHEPFGMDESGKIIRGGYPDPRSKSFIDGRSAYLTARAFVDALLRWTDWMKREGVYDNTLIVVLSDHGNNAEDHDLRFGKALDNPADRHDLSRARALLMYKSFGARGDLRRDEELRGTADASVLLFGGLRAGAGGARDPAPVAAADGNERDFGVLHGDWADFLANEKTDFTEYRVRGDMNDPAAWSKD